MPEPYTSQSKAGWTRFVENLESAFVFPKGRGGRLVRPRFPRKIAGVCSGLAEYFCWNVTLLRVLVVVLAVASTGFMVLAYAAAWVLVPEGPYSLAERSAGTSPS